MALLLMSIFGKSMKPLPWSPCAQWMSFKLDPEKVNINGGACALGHPVGSTGSRIILTLIHALKRTGGKKGIAALCIGGGEATAVAIELL